MNTSIPVKPPSRKESFTLRLMILCGFVCMVFFIYSLLSDNAVVFAPLYWCLVTAIVFGCMKVLYEWFHYFFITVPETPPLQKQFTVDVFTTFCKGEPYKMIEETLAAVQAITYPHTTYLCDEANDDFLKELCKKLGVVHVTRTDKRDAKAGNINNALRQATGELCVVLDPDHVPAPVFLDNVVAHFNNEKIGYVQVVQAYKNYDDSLIAKGAAQQTYQFYGPIMMTMNRLGTVLAIGANCTFRRAALDSIGGHAAGLAEDMHTSMQLHAKGWQSVYVPAVVARGLVPNTLSAYYSQQLKWARGVFELWVTSYVKLFRQFTLLQKIHYGLIPMHYLSGIIFLINFLVPVIALLFDVSPVKIDFGLFALAGFPLVVFIVLIRHYVQKWVMEDKERGFHVVGGLLMIGTWWVYITGLVYTIFRKEVPYIPTPKDSSQGDKNWMLHIPNAAMLLLSFAAIVYGLNYDWNPYNIIMAGFAAINCAIMSFNIWAGLQVNFKKRNIRQGWISSSVSHIKEYKGQFWLLRRKVYGMLRKVALPLTIIVLVACFWVIKLRSAVGSYTRQLIHKENIFITGIFAPSQQNGLTSPLLAKQYEQQSGSHFTIQSFYISWGNKPECFVPLKLMDTVYSNGAIPMITWEPWGNLFQSDSVGKFFKDEKIFVKIVAGNYDAYLTAFSQQLRALKRPVYLRFAHEADNPFYPWSVTGSNTPAEFKAAWKYVHDFFTAQGANNVIWVWNPWKPTAVNAYFPGKEYVDWIGVTALNFGSYNTDKKWYSFSELYSPFHYNPIFRQGIPVMLAETGSLPSEGRQEDWFKEMFSSIQTKFPEIKSVVLFNTRFDKNIPGGGEGTLNWETSDVVWKHSFQKQSDSQKPISANRQLAAILQPAAGGLPAKNLFAGIRGVNYIKGQEWAKNYHHFTKNDMLRDFEDMKAAGINTIKYYGPSVYDHNILGLAAKYDMQVHYGFWIPGNIDFTNDSNGLEALNSYILKSVHSLKDNSNVTAWNIGNNVFQKFAAAYDKPALLYHRDAYLQWLKGLVAAIKKIDTKRPVTINVDVDEDLLYITQLLAASIPQVDAFGLVLNEKAKGKELINRLQYPWFYSKIRAATYVETSTNTWPAFITSWQDQERRDYVSFEGLNDIWGRKKHDLGCLINYWKGDTVKALPEVRILKPAAATFVNTPLSYHAVVFQNNEFKLAKSVNTGFEFKWVLVKTDGFGNGFFMKELGTGPYITFNIPEAPDTWELFVFAKDKNGVVVAHSTLNTPLIAKQPNLKK